jgi:hypothetical protein
MSPCPLVGAERSVRRGIPAKYRLGLSVRLLPLGIRSRYSIAERSSVAEVAPGATKSSEIYTTGNPTQNWASPHSTWFAPLWSSCQNRSNKISQPSREELGTIFSFRPRRSTKSRTTLNTSEPYDKDSVPELGVIDYHDARRSSRRAIPLVRGLFGEISGVLKPALFGDRSLIGC